jgi:hypothetical protein
MVPNFHDQLNLGSNRRRVDAGGPCNWEEGDDWAEIRDLTITQGSVVAKSTGSTTVHYPDDDEWWLDATAPTAFQRASAQASALAIVHFTNGTTKNVPWSETVQLH